MSRSRRQRGRPRRAGWITGPEIEEALRETAAQISDRPIIDQICETVAQIQRDRVEWFKAFADSFERDCRAQLEAFPEIYERTLLYGGASPPSSGLEAHHGPISRSSGVSISQRPLIHI